MHGHCVSEPASVADAPGCSSHRSTGRAEHRGLCATTGVRCKTCSAEAACTVAHALCCMSAGCGGGHAWSVERATGSHEAPPCGPLRLARRHRDAIRMNSCSLLSRQCTVHMRHQNCGRAQSAQIVCPGRRGRARLLCVPMVDVRSTTIFARARSGLTPGACQAPGTGSYAP